MGLMETSDPRYLGNRCREEILIPARRVPAPGKNTALAPGSATLPTNKL